MLIPQYTIRWLMALTAVCAGIFSIVAMGIRGHTWAACLSVAMTAAVILALTYAGLFVLVWLFSLVAGIFGRRERSPFKPDAATPCPSGREQEGPAAPILLEMNSWPVGPNVTANKKGS
ncbi:MAG: hypothetical protein ACLQNE_19865 [Thermoguttaceae bacterium]|jgi:hypothetical protein